jgi:putative restriction endonuclease
MARPLDTTLLQMRAVDAGFDLGPIVEGAWLRFTAPGNLATIWLTTDDGGTLVAMSPVRVAIEVGARYAVEPWEGARPPGAEAAWRCTSLTATDQLLRRVAVLGRVLPDQLLKRYNTMIEEEIERVLASSEMERIAEIKQRVGQDLYRAALMQYWSGRCAITGISEPSLLRASHAKPWRDATDRERLDVHNGLLLAAHLDIAFDKGFIAVADDGTVLVSPRLPNREREVLGVSEPRRVDGLLSQHAAYLGWHREHIWMQ